MDSVSRKSNLYILRSVDDNDKKDSLTMFHALEEIYSKQRRINDRRNVLEDSVAFYKRKLVMADYDDRWLLDEYHMKMSQEEIHDLNNRMFELEVLESKYWAIYNGLL
jgi:hypothetical protein